MSRDKSQMYVVYDCRCSWCHRRRTCLNFFKSATKNIAYWQESLCADCLNKAIAILAAKEGNA